MIKPCSVLSHYIKRKDCKKVLNRASKVTFKTTYNNLTGSEKHYIESGVLGIFEGTNGRGGYAGGKYEKYILGGGRKPKPIK